MIDNIIRELVKGDSRGLLKLPTDKVLVEDPEFCRYVELYAKVSVAYIILKFLHQYLFWLYYGKQTKKKKNLWPMGNLSLWLWQDEDAFFTDYAVSHKKLSELGFNSPSLGAARSSARIVVALAAVVVLFSYLFDIYRKSQVNKQDSTWIEFLHKISIFK